MDTNILLENGTNELEVLEFKVGDNSYGINVAKIREILTYQKVTPVPNAHEGIEGIFMPRDVMITAINLNKVLNIPGSKDTTADMMIVTNFNKLNIGFHVQSVVGIHRVSWADIIVPDSTLNIDNTGVATGVVKINDRLIIILDFEKIVADISPETGLKVSEIEQLGVRERSEAPILTVEDSPLLGKLIHDSLNKAGYSNVISMPNGQEAWDLLSEFKKSGNLHDKVRCVITDIEMPIMDGHRLTKLIKEDEVLKELPVVIFSSLVNDEMRAKGIALGANAQLSKPEIGNLVKIVDGLISK